MTLFSALTKRSSPALAVVALLVAAAMAGPSANADEQATGVVKQRMDTMNLLGKKMKTLKPLVRDAYDFDAARIAGLAREIQAISERVEAEYPEGSNRPPSDALPAIWQNWERFTDLVAQMRSEAERLEALARDGSQRNVLKQFAALGKTCRGCHTDFRRKID